MIILAWIMITIDLIMSAIAIGIMMTSLVNYIKDKIIYRQIEKEMLKKFKK